jgi:hemoglobin
MELSLYDKLGGSAGVHAIVEALYSRLLKDPEIAPLLQVEDLESQKRRQRLSLCQLFGGPPLAEPPALTGASLEKSLNGPHYDKFLTHLGETLVGLNIQIHLAAEIETMLMSLRTPAKQKAA